MHYLSDVHVYSFILDVSGELERVKYAIPFMTHANGINHVFDVVAGHHPAHAQGQTALHCASRAGHSKIVREVFLALGLGFGLM